MIRVTVAPRLPAQTRNDLAGDVENRYGRALRRSGGGETRNTAARRASQSARQQATRVPTRTTEAIRFLFPYISFIPHSFANAASFAAEAV